MPLTKFQSIIAKALAGNRAPDSYLAGGAAIHIEPNSKRYSNDLDYFHDSEERVAKAFEADRSLLERLGYSVKIEMNQPGYLRAIAGKGKQRTKIEWAHDSAWRFLPVIKNPACGFQLHPIDLAINKVLTLAGRDEPRDFIDMLSIHRDVLPLGALCWAAAGKDPGFTPTSLLELLKRRGKYRHDDFAKLRLAKPVDLTSLKAVWLEALESAARFIESRPADEIGCLYYSRLQDKFVAPDSSSSASDIVLHYGRPGGVLPKIS